MKRIPNKTKLNGRDSLVIEIDPSDFKNGIVYPKIEYKVVATVDHEQVFDGMVIPIPKVLLYFLNHNELMIVSTIIEETTTHGECALTVRQMSTKLKVSTPTLSNTLYKLRKAGLLEEIPNGKKGSGKIRKLNFKTVQHLNDLLEGENPGVFTRLRKMTRKTNLLNLNREDVKLSYDNKVLAPDHDPAEEEEYD